MEITIPMGEIPWRIFKNFSMVGGCMILLIAILIVHMVLKKKRGEPVIGNQKYMAIGTIMVFTVFLIVYISTITRDVLYTIDITNDNYIEETIYIVDTDYSRASCTLFGRNGEKYMFRNYDLKTIHYGEIYEEVKNNFIGKECTIEYYKLSKYVARIEVIE